MTSIDLLAPHYVAHVHNDLCAVCGSEHTCVATYLCTTTIAGGLAQKRVLTPVVTLSGEIPLLRVRLPTKRVALCVDCVDVYEAEEPDVDVHRRWQEAVARREQLAKEAKRQPAGGVTKAPASLEDLA